MSITHALNGLSVGPVWRRNTSSSDGRVLELVVCDVSGKGVDAGTRALLLSGAIGGLLGAMRRHRASVEELAPAVDHFLKVSRSYWPGLYAVVALVYGEFAGRERDVRHDLREPCEHVRLEVGEFVRRIARRHFQTTIRAAQGTQGGPVTNRAPGARPSRQLRERDATAIRVRSRIRH